ncbi:MAG TPA: S8 family serine peptidase, partial [Dehalococcoidia bacterium]|nr:S8 family serine peptidase [Dehalococcoidia bacterium]
MKYVAFATLMALAMVISAAWTPGTHADPAGQTKPHLQNNGLVSTEAAAAPDEITVRFQPGVTNGLMRRTAAATGASVLDLGARSHVMRLKAGDAANTGQLLRALRSNPLVAEAGPSHDAAIVSAPNDPMYPYQWHMRSAAGGSWTDTAWDMATNHGAGVTVAIIDTGVAYENYSGTVDGYQQTFAPAPDLMGATFVAPWDFANDDAHPNDDQGHGTHVAGTIGQRTNNGLGMAGVAYGASIMPLKALDYAGSGSEADVIESIYYAVDLGADVINMSLGFPDTGAPDVNGN